LQQVVLTQDHSLLDGLLAFISRFVLLGIVTLASAASGALAVRVASIPVRWQDKWHYWDLLDDLTAALGQSTPDGLRIQLRKIAALPPPV
jgi:hypothetical protein